MRAYVVALPNSPRAPRLVGSLLDHNIATIRVNGFSLKDSRGSLTQAAAHVLRSLPGCMTRLSRAECPPSNPSCCVSPYMLGMAGACSHADAYRASATWSTSLAVCSRMEGYTLAWLRMLQRVVRDTEKSRYDGFIGPRYPAGLGPTVAGGRPER